MNTYGIVRVSTIGQEENTSIDFQTEKLTQYATLNNLHLKKVITDVCSGSYETRDGIDELKSLIDAGKVDVVLIWNTSRAFRSMIAFSKFYEYLKKNEVELISVSEGIRSSRKEGEMLFGIMCSVASYEKDIIVSRMMSGKIQLAKSGERSFGGRLPYGYTKSENGDIVLDETESEIVEYIFRKRNLLTKMKHLTPKKRTKRLLQLLKNRGFKYRDGNDFQAYHLRTLLNNEFYIGMMKYGAVENTHNYPPIISKRLFNQVQVGLV